MRLVVAFSDRSLADYANRLEQLAAGSGRAMLAQSLNQAGAEIRHETVAAEAKQTALSGALIDRAQHAIDATAGSLTYTITARGGDVRLKFFGAKENSAGVSADPWGRQTEYADAWIKGGFHGRRVDLGFGGEVKRRVGASRLPTKTVKSGLFIPTEMVKGQTAGVFDVSSSVAASRIVSRLGALLAS